MRAAFVFVLLLSSLPLFAQEDSTEVATGSGYVNPEDTHSSARYRKEKVDGKRFDQKKWKEVTGSMNYDEAAEKEKKEKDKRKPKEGWNFNFGIPPATMRVISFIVVFVLFAFILYYVAQNTKFKQKIKKTTEANVAGPVENIEELDTGDLLRQAMESEDLRMAVRIRYLLLLKKLNEVGLIVWKKDKTNREYLSELYGRDDFYENVRGLTLAYELVWYGERSVSSESFQRLNGEFESVNNRITREQPNT
ncbi:MAG TPA: DUF4129 domain-containing protein [Cyclobacteriaceae bacterium]